MPRLVLLGLGKEDVDVLSRVAALVPRPEVLVVHPDSGALVVQLARLAELPVAAGPVDPRVDDVVVVPERDGGGLPEPIEGWRRLGARIVRPSALGEVWPLEPVAAHLEREPQAVQRLKVEIEKTSRWEPMDKDTNADSLSPPPGDNLLILPTEAPPAEVWESPEATFRYLVAGIAGDRPVTLWWDGSVGAWVPWLWTGPEPLGSDEDVERGLEVPSEWGSFRLVGIHPERDLPHLGAFARVAEDAALRDLMGWQRTMATLAGLGLPDPHAEAGVLEAWAGPVLCALGAHAGLLWRRGGEGWRLVHAHGDGVEFRGELVFADPLLTATFESAGAPWRPWGPVEGLRVYLAGIGDDPRWLLRQRRVELALAGTGS